MCVCMYTDSTHTNTEDTHMPYNSKTAKPVYYKQNVTNIQQLFDNIIRLQYDSRMDGSTKAQYIENMFNSYLQVAKMHVHVI